MTRLAPIWNKPTASPGEGRSVGFQAHTRAHCDCSPGTCGRSPALSRETAGLEFHGCPFHPPGPRGPHQCGRGGERGDFGAGVGCKQFMVKPSRQAGTLAAQIPVGSSMLGACAQTRTLTHAQARAVPSAPPPVYPPGAGNKNQVFTKRTLASPWRLNDFMVEAIGAASKTRQRSYLVYQAQVTPIVQ